MTLKLRAALRRLRAVRQNRRLAIERARLQEMRENARDLLRAQEILVASLARRVHDDLPETDIARQIERRAKAPLLA